MKQRAFTVTVNQKYVVYAETLDEAHRKAKRCLQEDIEDSNIDFELNEE